MPASPMGTESQALGRREDPSSVNNAATVSQKGIRGLECVWGGGALSHS